MTDTQTSPANQAPQTETCSNCRFSRLAALPPNVPDGLECHRKPPTIHGKYVMAYWPNVAPDAWCGEWQAKR